MAKSDEYERLMRTEGATIRENTQGFNEGRYESVAKLEDYEALKDEARAIKEDAIERLPELIEELREAVEANGGTLYVATDAADANEYIREVVAEREAERVVKSKSMTTEEIEVNEALERDGVDVVETDLGEWVIQLADESPSHIVGPAIHKSRDEIADLLNERFDPDPPLETAEELTQFAREQLGESIESAEVGMTGANFVAAESGTMALVTSEGNARKTVAATDTHIAVAGVEKVVPSVEDLAAFVELIGRSGTGQDITSYVSLLTPPVDSPVVDFADDETSLSELGEERDFHLVLIDNGRLAMRDDDQLRETLYCIRCGACSNSCANFQSVGGHGFGGETYSGGIATGWEAGVEGLDTAAEFNDFCTGCTRCAPACPVKIDIPWINTVVRDRINRGADPGKFDPLVDGLTPDAEGASTDDDPLGGATADAESDGRPPLDKRFFGNFERIAGLGSATAPVSNWLADLGPSRWLMERALGIDRRRDLPEFRRETFREWAADRGSASGTATSNATAENSDGRRVVVYPDLYTNHVQVDRGKATVRVLEALGCEVVVPDVRASGRAPFSQGMLATATDHAGDVVAGLEPYVASGYDVVVIEPSDLAMIDREYEKILGDEHRDALDAVADGSYEAMEYVYGLLEQDGRDPSGLVGAAADDAIERRDAAAEAGVVYHSHCQQRTLGLEGYTVAVLERLGYDVTTTDVECCGMAGSFGYKADYYEVSMDVGAQLREQLDAAGNADRVPLASGTSCLEQIDALLSRSPAHPIELLDPDSGS